MVIPLMGDAVISGLVRGLRKPVLSSTTATGLYGRAREVYLRLLCRWWPCFAPVRRTHDRSFGFREGVEVSHGRIVVHLALSSCQFLNFAELVDRFFCPRHLGC